MSKNGIKPHLPFFCANGNKVVETWEELTQTRDGLRQKLIWVRYRDPKGKEAEVVRQVVWIDIPHANAHKRYQ